MWGLTLSRSVARFVDPAGSDSNSGLTPAAAWQTLAKVSAATDLDPGDCVLLNRSSRWREGLKLEAAKVNGKVGAPIRVGAYGVGVDPIISGSEVISTSGWSAATSPTASETFVSDTFTRADAATDLGSAASGTDSSKTWSQSATDFGISSNAGIATKNFGTMRASVGDDHTESCDILIDFVGIPATSGPNQGCALWGRMTGGFGAGYQIQYLRSTTTFQVRKWALGSPTTIDTATVSALTNATMRVQIINVPTGAQIRARIWQTGDSEPGTWDLDYTDASSPRGNGVLGISAENNTAASDVTFDNFIAKSYVPVYASTYSRTLTTDPTTVLVEDGEILDRADSADDVELTAGSFYWESNLLYVHASDGSSPATSGKVYEAGTRTYAVYVSAVDDAIVEDVIVEHGTLFGLQTGDVSNRPEIRRVTARQSNSYGIYLNPITGGAGESPWVHDCTVYGNRGYGGIGGNCEGTGIIEGNEVYDNGYDDWYHHGIYMGGNGSGTFICRDNVTYENAAFGIKNGHFLTSSYIYRNVSYLNGRGDYVADGGGSEHGSIGSHFWNNVGFGSPWGLTVYNFDGLNAVTVDECKNNIFAFNTLIGINIVGPDNVLNGFENNDVFGAPTLYSGIASQTGSDGNISSDPLFVDAPSADFTLDTGSPCIEAGVEVPEISTGPAPDMGAYELVGA